jgi:hypothetical protein
MEKFTMKCIELNIGASERVIVEYNVVVVVVVGFFMPK